MVSCFWDQDWIPVKHSSVNNSNIQSTNEFNKSSNSYYIPVCCLFLYTHCYHNKLIGTYNEMTTTTLWMPKCPITNWFIFIFLCLLLSIAFTCQIANIYVKWHFSRHDHPWKYKSKSGPFYTLNMVLQSGTLAMKSIDEV